MTHAIDSNFEETVLADLRRSYAARLPHPPGSPAERRLVRNDGEATRDARTILLAQQVRRAHADASDFAVVEHPSEHLTRLDEWDAAATVLDTALSLLVELHAPADLARALAAIAAELADCNDYHSETILNVLDNVRHGHPAFGNVDVSPPPIPAR